MKCENCSNPATSGAVIGDRYYEAICNSCLSDHKRLTSAGNAQFQRELDKRDYARDIIQPFEGGSKPNPEFIRAYPDKAKEMFTKKELRNYG